MKKLLFCMCFLIIVSAIETAKAAITCPWEEATISGFFGFSAVRYPSREIPDSRLSLFEYLHRTPHSGASSFDVDAPAIFAQAKKESKLDENEDLSASILLVDESVVIASEHFRYSGRSSFDDRHLKGNSTFSADTMEYLNAKYMKNEGPSDLPTSLTSDNEGRIQGIEYDVIDVVPAPGAFILGGVGLGVIGWLRRHRTL